MDEDGVRATGRGRWHGADYAGHAGHHRRADAWFLERHPPRVSDDIVDAGSGSGDFTARLATIATGGRVVGVEPDPSMLAAARRHDLPNLEFRRGRLQELDRVCGSSSADLVVSRAVFHWIEPAEHLRCYRAVREVLRPGGWFHAESGGAGNLEPVVRRLDAIAREHGLPTDRVSFPHAGTAYDLLARAGFHLPPDGVATVAQRRGFDRDGFLGFLRTQATRAYLGGEDDGRGDDFLAAVERRVDEFRAGDGSYDQTFVRLVVLAQRPTGPPTPSGGDG